MVLSAIPVCASFPMDRLLVFVGVGGAGLLACLLDQSGWLHVSKPALWNEGPELAAGRSRVGPDSVWASRPRRWAVGALVILHLIIAPLILPVRAIATRVGFNVFDMGEQQIPNDPLLPSQQVVFVNGQGILVGYALLIRSLDGGFLPRNVETLANILMSVEVSRPARDVLVVVAQDGYLATPTQTMLRSPSIPFERGQTIQRAAMRVVVEEITDDGRPTRVSFHFPTTLENETLRFLYWKDQQLQPFPLPPVGGSVAIEPSIFPIF